MTNLETIEQFFSAYQQGDRGQIEQLLATEAAWTFPGQHPLAGVKKGIHAILAFFDEMGSVMAKSNAQVEKLAVVDKPGFVIEVQHIRTNREKGENLDRQICVLWQFSQGKIISGRHFTADLPALDRFFADQPVTEAMIKERVSKGRQYTLFMYKAGPRCDQPEAEVDRLQAAHLKFLFSLRAEGKLLLNGPVLAPDSDTYQSLKGIGILETPDLQAARAILENDPSVKAGRLVFELFAWFGLPGDNLPA